MQSNPRGACLAALLIVTLSLDAPAASAAEPTPAQRLHEAAVEAHGARRLRQAIELWRDALALEPDWKYAYNLANTLYEVEDGRAAWGALARVDALSPPDKYIALVAELRSKVRALLYRDHAWLVLVGVPEGASVNRDGERWEPPWEAWVDRVESRVEVVADGFEPWAGTVRHPIGERTERRIELARRVAPPPVVQGLLRVDGAPAGANVSVGGVARGVLPLAPFGLGPGDVEVRVSHPGYVEEVRVVNVAPGQETPLSITLRREVPAEEPMGLATPGWITLASGLVLAGVGTGFYLWAADTHDELQALNNDADALSELGFEGYQRRFGDLDGALHDRLLASQIFFAAGATAAITGVVLIALDAGSDRSDTSMRVVPVSGGALIVGGASFR